MPYRMRHGGAGIGVATNGRWQRISGAIVRRKSGSSKMREAVNAIKLGDATQ